MADITLSSAVRNNLLSLQNTSSLLETTQNRLATGQRVNSALDDPSAFFTASSLNSRAGDLNRLLDSVGLAVQTVEAADKGISSITKLVEAAQASARNALQASSPVTTAATVTGTGATLQADALATTGAGSGVTDLSGNTDLLAGALAEDDSFNINGTNIRFGTDAGEVDTTEELLSRINNTVANVTASLSDAGELVLTADNADTNILITDGGAGAAAVTSQLGLTATTSDATSTNLISQGAVTAGQTLTFQVGAATSTITFGTNDGLGQVSTLAELTTAVSNLAGNNGIGAASIDTSGNITVTAANTTDSVTAGGTATLANFGLNSDQQDPVTANNGTRAAAENEFNNLLSQIDQLAADASFNGNNLLAGDNLTVIFNEDGSSSLAVTGVNFDSDGLSVNNVAAGAFQNDTAINTTLGELDSAISTLRTQAATFGSNLSVVQIRQDFTKNLINTLETGAAGLTLADANQEAANVLALQTRQSLSSSSLSLASRSDQSVLQLLR